MNGILPGYIFVVIIFLWIPLNYGCFQKSVEDFMKCTDDITQKINRMTNDDTKSDINLLCSESKGKEGLRVCLRKLYKCEEIGKYALFLGLDTSRMFDAAENMCKHKEDLISGKLCFIKDMANIQVDFMSKYGNITTLLQNVMTTKVGKDEYFKEYCPIMKNIIDKMTGGRRCPEKFNNLLHEYFYNIMSDDCKKVNNIYSDGVKAVSNIYFILLSILTILFTIG